MSEHHTHLWIHHDPALAAPRCRPADHDRRAGCPRAGCDAEQVLQQLRSADLQPPYVAKPLWADGREGAHGLAVLHDEAGVRQLLSGDVPAGLSDTLLLSPCVQHGGCLFKVRCSHAGRQPPLFA